MNDRVQRDRKWITLWLFAGVIMVFVQILLGGVTRLTGSGLSITKWDIVTGTIPPLNVAQWQEAFELYQQTPQYQKINEGMSLAQFRFIYFWEYLHRLWARAMGFVFLIPFILFYSRGSLHRSLIKRLVVVVMMAALAALFGWIMVASGLINRPWVNAYKLTVHLGLGILLFVYLFYTWLTEKGYSRLVVGEGWQKAIRALIILTIIQICFGGFVSGMKSAMNYPTWPLMNGTWVPDIILDIHQWNSDNFLLYDQSGFMPALVQFIHRNLGYALFILILAFSYRWIKSLSSHLHGVAYMLVGIIVVQVALGVMTLLGSKGSIPVFYGVFHQGLGILFLTMLVYLGIRIKPKSI